MSKSIHKLLLLAMCSLPATAVMAAAGGGGAPSLSQCSALTGQDLIPHACKEIEDTQAVFKTYSPPQPFLKTELTEYQADQPAQSSSNLVNPPSNPPGGIGGPNDTGNDTW